MTEQPADASPSLPSPPPSLPPVIPRVIGRLGLFATYVAAALCTLVIAGDVDILGRHAPMDGWLAVLVGAGPLVVLLLSTVASYINYYGVWRIVRRQDEFDAGEDLKSHAADVPETVQAMLAGRTGCLPAASSALLVIALLLLGASSAPPQTPVIGMLGTWHSALHVPGTPRNQSDVVLTGGRATPTIAVLPTSSPAPTVTPSPTTAIGTTPTMPPGSAPRSSAPPRSVPTPSPTATPLVMKFAIAPTAASWNCHNQGNIPGPQTITLDNTGSTVSVSWQATAVEQAAGAAWAAISPGSGTIPAHGQQTMTITPDPNGSSMVCLSSAPNGTPWHVNIVANGVSTSTFAYSISYYLT